MTLDNRYMMPHSTITALKAVLGGGLLGALLAQCVILPWLAKTMADDYPEAAHMRWPVLAASIAGLICVEVVVVATWGLLNRVRQARIFDRQSLRWVDCIIGALLAGVLVSLVMLVYLFHVGLGPITVPATALLCAVGGVGAVLLMVVMRSLLVQATDLRSEMDEVI